MGAYSSQPVTDCESVDNENHRIRYGSSSMQGWRKSQEDSLNCCPAYDEASDSMLFAVYDGHGGSEVAEYCAKHLPDFIKQLKSYKAGCMEQALIDAFLDFDATLVLDDAVSKLKMIATRPESPVPPNLLRIHKSQLLKDDDEDDDDHDDTIEDEPTGDFDEDETAGLLEDACTPIDQVLQKLTNGEVTGPITKQLSADKQKNNASEESAASTTSSAPQTNESVSSISSSATSGAGASGAAVSEVADASEAGGSGLSSKSPGSADLINGADSDDDSDDDTSDGSDYAANASGDEDDESEDEEVLEEMKQSQELAMKFAESDDYLEVPGCDSGCTACLALITGNKLYVANAGDSRCVLSRNGKAIDLSVDHKPEDEVEKQRIEKAGGFVSPDGRVNGNLNLSRAIGDHNYKKNRELPLRDQMITALPDVQCETLTADDEFVIIACDGIWNSVSSQECVDFVKIRIERGDKLSQICEDLFHSVLAEDTMEGDGTGCDNMTCIILDLQKSKRPDIKNERTSSTGFDHTFEDDPPVSPHPDEPPSKLQKTS